MSNKDLRLRSGQLIVPFGIGQIVPNKEGKSLMVGGLNLWDKMISQRDSEGASIAIEELEIFDIRLQKLLGVKKFIKPFPFYERSSQNRMLQLPAIVFPRWHYCNQCKVMKKSGLTDVETYCIEDNCYGNRNKMIPVRFIAACDSGHIQDIPFQEWAHKNGEMCANPKIAYNAFPGSGSLSDINISCQNCNEKSSLNGLLKVSRSDENGLIDSSALNSELDIKCEGHKPWIGQKGLNNPDSCTNHLQVIISGGSNVHYANISSALVLPDFNEEERINALLKPLNIESIRQIIDVMEDDNIKLVLSKSLSVINDIISEEELLDKINLFLNEEEVNNYDELQMRHEEFQFFKKNNNTRELKSSIQNILDTKNDIFDGIIKNIVLVDKLKEIRVFSGFTRLNSINMSNLKERKDFLSDESPDWLPAYEHYGEGIFIEFNFDRLSEIIMDFPEHPRIENFNKAQLSRNPESFTLRDIDNIFITIHTLSHLLIRRLCYSCGYGSSSLKERMYYSTKEKTRMAGLLIYTASGDSEGSLGGLVSQGQIENFKGLFQEALLDSGWCSSDPVCSDIGEKIGQGPNNVNGAACHNCCIVPETSCEEFNSLLDRNILLKILKNLV